MGDLLVTLMQLLCLAGYAYGALLVLAHGANADVPQPRKSAEPGSGCDEDNVAIVKYLALDA